jgi:hypothetical protein
MAKAATGSVPLAGAVLTEIADAKVPDHEARDRERWEGDVTDGFNDLHGRVDDLDERIGEHRITLTGATAAAAKYIIEHCPDGLARNHVSVQELQQACPDFTRDNLLDAMGDLESYGLVDSISFIGTDDIYHLTQSGYEVLDEPIMGWETLADARKIAGIAARMRDGVMISDIESELGWPRRRLNPALKIVVGFIHPGRVSAELQPYYLTNYFSPSNAELAHLRRFAAG